MDKDEIDKLTKRVERHKTFVSDEEFNEIDGIPRQIRQSNDGSSVERKIKKLEHIASDNDDPELRDITRKMRRQL